MNKQMTLGTLFALGSLLGCGGGNTPPPAPQATALTYTNPVSGDYQLVKNTTLSTASHLVLDLVGPATGTGSGLSITLTAGAQVAWANVSSADPAGTYLTAGNVFSLGSAPQIRKAQVSGNTLVATLAEKGFGSPKPLNAPLLRLALDFRTGQGTAPGTSVTLTAGDCKVLDGTGTLRTIALTSGTLATQ